jgi:hypothetical protein
MDVIGERKMKNKLNYFYKVDKGNIENDCLRGTSILIQRRS